MANVIPFNAAQRLAANAKLAEQQRQQVDEAGNHAWGRLQKARKLNKKDRIEIAKVMHELLEELKQRHPKLSMGKLAKTADLPKTAGLPNSKELYRLTLPPGEDPIKRGLRAAAKNYVNLLKAIQRVTGDNMAPLADRLTWATSLHPKQTPGTEESERMADYLQEAIIRVDRKFKEASGGDSLFDTFMKTARIKADMAKQGGRLRWPYYDLDADFDDNGSSGQKIEHEFQPLEYGGFPSDRIPRREDDSDVRYAYWQRDYDQLESSFYLSGLTQYEALMQLPRIYLGLVDWDRCGNYFNSLKNTEEADAQGYEIITVYESDTKIRKEVIKELKSHIDELGEIRDSETGYAHFAHRSPETGELIQGLGSEYEHNAHMWLVIYPSHDNKSLLPVVYYHSEDGGTVLTPLTQRSLVSLREIPFVDAGEPRSLYDRTKELMRASSDHAIYKAWQETAKDVLDNPILRAYRKNLAEQDDFERGMADF